MPHLPVALLLLLLLLGLAAAIKMIPSVDYGILVDLMSMP
jgi:hypothetical protein